MVDTSQPLKNMYNETFYQMLANAVHSVHNNFDTRQFIKEIFDDEWEGRELKARVRHTTHTLKNNLPEDYRTALGILREAAPQLDGMSYEPMIFPDFVEVYGLDDWDASIPALEQFTKQTSAEFAVRPFIMQDEDRMMAQMLTWSTDENHHLRRLASEGCRPRLPWAMALPKFKQDPAPILPILENLRHDETDYVRRSVGNNLNDITKDNPQVVIDTLTRWEDGTYEVRWIMSHALRSLVKAGDAQALNLLGFGTYLQLELSDFSITPTEIPMGGEVEFSFNLRSTGTEPQKLMIDYVMEFVRANAKTTQKVFKLTKNVLEGGETLHLQKTYSFRPISTRRYYPGEHAIEVQVNGVRLGRVTFMVGDDES